MLIIESIEGIRAVPSSSLGFKDTLSDHVVAEFVNSNNQIIVVSCQQIEVHSEIKVAHVHHVLKVLYVCLILDVSCSKFLLITHSELIIIRHNLFFFNNWNLNNWDLNRSLLFYFFFNNFWPDEFNQMLLLWLIDFLRFLDDRLLLFLDYRFNFININHPWEFLIDLINL